MWYIQLVLKRNNICCKVIIAKYLPESEVALKIISKSQKYHLEQTANRNGAILTLADTFYWYFLC